MSTVGILVRPDLGKAGPAVRDLVAGCRSAAWARAWTSARPRWWKWRTACPAACASSPDVVAGADVLVVLGGDGTLLAASHLVTVPSPCWG
jgi:NAD kinase